MKVHRISLSINTTQSIILISNKDPDSKSSQSWNSQRFSKSYRSDDKFSAVIGSVFLGTDWTYSFHSILSKRNKKDSVRHDSIHNLSTLL